jgi:hypothetical protein
VHEAVAKEHSGDNEQEADEPGNRRGEHAEPFKNT